MQFTNHTRNEFGKTDTPERTVAKIRAGFERLGYAIRYLPFQVADHIHWSVIAIDALNLQCQGKGLTPELARASAHAELAERFSGGLFFQAFEEQVRFNMPALYGRGVNRFLNYEWLDGYVNCHQDELTGNLVSIESLLRGQSHLSTADKDRRLLVVLDQFEDVLYVPTPGMLERLREALRAVRALRFRNLRILVSYRADAVGTLGPFFQALTERVADHVFTEERAVPRGAAVGEAVSVLGAVASGSAPEVVFALQVAQLRLVDRSAVGVGAARQSQRQQYCQYRLHNHTACVLEGRFRQSLRRRG